VKDLNIAIENISPLSGEICNIFIQTWKKINVPKDYCLLRENTPGNYLYFVQKGILRIYYHKNEKEVTEWIAMDGSFCFSILSFFEKLPSKLIIHAIEPSEVFSLHRDDLMRLCDQHHEIEKWLRKAITGSLILSQHRMESIQFETAQQRYDNLLKKMPQLVQRVPLSYIASFLGITQETLSRIRSNH
jgi:CRP-like cAMP-binding protein